MDLGHCLVSPASSRYQAFLHQPQPLPGWGFLFTILAITEPSVCEYRELNP